MLKTPYYLIDKQKLLGNLQKIAYVREHSGAKALLALKCFATWSVFDLMEQYMDGTTSSSLYELKLGRQKFAGETHAYSVAWADDEIPEMLENCDKIIFNTISQLERFDAATAGAIRGLRVNPQVSSSDYLLADPARPITASTFTGSHSPRRLNGRAGSAWAAASISPAKAIRWNSSVRDSRRSPRSTPCRFTWSRARQPSRRARRWK